MDDKTPTAWDRYREQAEQCAEAKGENPKLPGELGESGENPAMTRVSGRANRGEKRANFAPFTEYESPPYPIDALGPLKPVADAISRNGQIDPAIAERAADLADIVREVRNGR
jgi:hypothetical protein